MVPLVMRGDDVVPLVDLVRSANGRDGFQVSITGSLTADADFEKLSGEDLQKGELLIGLPAALIVLVLVFGAVVAGLVPVLLGLLSIVVAVALTALVGQAFEVSFFVVNMISAMGLALGIDYALFILSRYREERARGLEKVDAIVASGATASRAVLFSGIAFVLAMFGMLLVPDTILRSLALGAILVGIVSVLAALTLLPAVLSLLGDRVNAVRIPVIGRRAISERRLGGPLLVGARRRRHAAAAREPRGGDGAPARRRRCRCSRSRRASRGSARCPTASRRSRASTRSTRDFPGAGVDPAQIVDPGRRRLAAGAVGDREARGEPRRPGRRSAPPTQTRVGERRRRRAVGARRGRRRRAGGDGRDPPPARRSDPAGVRRRRGDGARRRHDGRERRTTSTSSAAGCPIVFAFVLGLSFILLTVAFRSIVIPAVAIALNLLSVGAAYGLLVLVFQKGVGNELLGFQQVDTVEAWVPLFLFSVLFGLSMDYQVFLLSRIKERYAQTGDTAGAVAFGVGSTARLITGAALIIIAVFSGFAAGDLVMFQQMGFGVAVALLVDATIVRCVLVPASMKLLGERNWYLPSWLEWVPDVHVEGHAERRPPEAAPLPTSP